MCCLTIEEAFRGYRVLLEIEKMQNGEEGYIIYHPNSIDWKMEVLCFLAVACIPLGYIIVDIICRFLGMEL